MAKGCKGSDIGKPKNWDKLTSFQKAAASRTGTKNNKKK